MKRYRHLITHMKQYRHLIISAAIFAALALSAVARDYLELIGDADKAISESRWDDAIGLLDQAMRENPDNPSNVLLLSNTGMLNYYAGRDSIALERLDLAHRMSPASVTVLCNRARVLTSLGDIDAALADYDRATALDSTAIEPYYYRGLIYLAARDTADADADLSRLERLAPDNMMTHEALAIYHSDGGRYAEAIPHYNVLLDNAPTARLYAERAICRLRTGDYGTASQDIALGLELDENCADLYAARALYYRLCYREDDAMADLRRAIDHGASQAWLKELLGL